MWLWFRPIAANLMGCSAMLMLAPRDDGHRLSYSRTGCQAIGALRRPSPEAAAPARSPHPRPLPLARERGAGFNVSPLPRKGEGPGVGASLDGDTPESIQSPGSRQCQHEQRGEPVGSPLRSALSVLACG